MRELRYSRYGLSLDGWLFLCTLASVAALVLLVGFGNDLPRLIGGLGDFVAGATVIAVSIFVTAILLVYAVLVALRMKSVQSMKSELGEARWHVERGLAHAKAIERLKLDTNQPADNSPTKG